MCPGFGVENLKVQNKFIERPPATHRTFSEFKAATVWLLRHGNLRFNGNLPGFPHHKKIQSLNKPRLIPTIFASGNDVFTRPAWATFWRSGFQGTRVSTRLRKHRKRGGLGEGGENLLKHRLFHPQIRKCSSSNFPREQFFAYSLVLGRVFRAPFNILPPFLLPNMRLNFLWTFFAPSSGTKYQLPVIASSKTIKKCSLF